MLKAMHVDRFIFTGPPGAGKTTLLQRLAQDGLSIVAEAASDLIAARQRLGLSEPWKDPSFVDAIAHLQRERQITLGQSARIQLYDRSPICTLALANWLGHAISDELNREVGRMLREQIYRPEIFFIESLGFVTLTQARRIDFADSIRFGRLHEQTYAAYGFRTILVKPAPVAERAAAARKELVSLCGPEFLDDGQNPTATDTLS
jgi:predicted ATPase